MRKGFQACGNLSAKKVLDSERFFLTENRMPLYCPHRVKAAQRDKMLPPIKGDTMNQINVTAKTKTGLTYDVQINLEHQMKVTINGQFAIHVYQRYS